MCRQATRDKSNVATKLGRPARHKEHLCAAYLLKVQRQRTMCHSLSKLQNTRLEEERRVQPLLACRFWGCSDPWPPPTDLSAGMEGRLLASE